MLGHIFVSQTVNSSENDQKDQKKETLMQLDSNAVF